MRQPNVAMIGHWMRALKLAADPRPIGQTLIVPGMWEYGPEGPALLKGGMGTSLILKLHFKITKMDLKWIFT
jgi:hypothetical protein